MKTNPPLVLLSAFVAIASAATAFADAATLAQAKAALDKNDLAAAEALLVPLADADLPDAAACHQLGLVRLRQGRADDAIALLERATQRDRTKAGYFSALGSAIGQKMSKLPMMQQAMFAMKLKQAFERAVELDPNHVPGLIGLARYYTSAPEFAGGSIERAQELAARVKRLAPFLGELEFGNIAEHTGEDEAAAAHYAAAARLAPANPHPHTAAARVLARLGRNDEARAHLESALTLNPSDQHAQSALAALDSPSSPAKPAATP